MQGMHKNDNSADEIKCLLALKKVDGIGNAIAFKLIQHFQSAQSVFQANSKQLKDVGLKPALIDQITHFDFSTIDPILAWSEQPNRHIIGLNSAFYPPLLSQINSPPLFLFALGNPEILLTPQIAVVGTRNPSIQGAKNAELLCHSLCEQGITITSGLAAGIDGEAHRAALSSNSYTVAVTGTGLNRVYPPTHRELAHQIAQNGVLVSEKFPDEPVGQGSFPQRNRIIAGLSLGTLVIEAALKSGSLITAQVAMNEGREVFAVPGSIHNPQAKGCHKLIKQGAKLVESLEDIIEDLPCIAKGLIDKSEPASRPQLKPQEADFLKYVDYDITPIDLIVTRSQLTVEAVTNKLLLLELAGWVINSAGGYIRQ
jgi:DNA processing protein